MTFKTVNNSGVSSGDLKRGFTDGTAHKEPEHGDSLFSIIPSRCNDEYLGEGEEPKVESGFLGRGNARWER